MDYALHGSFQSGNRFEGFYNDFDTLYNMVDGWSGFETYTLSGELNFKGLEAAILLDRMQAKITGYSKGQTNSFGGSYGRAAYHWKANPKLEITPTVSFKRQTPYSLKDTAWYYDKVFSRFESGVVSTYQPIKQLALTAGFSYYYDLASDFGEEGWSGFYNGRNEVSFENLSAFMHGIIKLGGLNIIAGGRIDKHSQSGFNFSPRLGITGVPGRFHYKLLYSQAFRAPSVENINLNQSIDPERTQVIEIETGYKISTNQFITLNLFDITIKDPIVYLYYPGSDTEEEYEMYQNYSRTGTRGFEAEYRMRYETISLSANYAFYCARDKNEVDAYAVTTPDSSLIETTLKAAPRHKINLYLQWQPFTNLFVTPSASWMSKRYGYIENSEEQTFSQAALLANLFIQYENVLVKGLNAGFGVYNLLNAENTYIQPFATQGNAVAPYPYYSREFLVKISYRLPL